MGDLRLTLPAYPGRAFTRGFYSALKDHYPGSEVGQVAGVPGGMRQAIVVEYGGKRIMIHAWDYSQNLQDLTPDNIDLVMCVQYTDALKDAPVKIVPFTMFASDQPTFYKKLPDLQKIADAQEKQYEVGFSGRLWRHRKPWWAQSVGKDWFYWENTHGQATGTGTVEEYAAKMGAWQRCLILYGKGSRTNASHNRRENECAALGIPMILNYKPHYYVPFEAGVHYTYHQVPGELDCYAPIPGAGLSSKERDQVDAAREYWVQNMSAPGIVRLFKQICDEQL